MKYPNFSEEKKLWAQEYNFVVGLDEAGRGPLAGPVVACAVMLNRIVREFSGIKDSKTLSAKKREFFYKKLTRHPNIQWGIGAVSEKLIDEINILEASKLAMIQALESLKIKPDFLILDGNFKINSPIFQKSIVAADQKVFSCTAAGIIAKVTRDRIMSGLHKKYPQYGFNFHKGYCTKLHVKNLNNFGPCPIHRKSFHPVRSFISPGKYPVPPANRRGSP